MRQVYNMAPVIYLFLMAAFAENLEEIWEDNSLKKLNFNECLTMILTMEKEL